VPGCGRWQQLIGPALAAEVLEDMSSQHLIGMLIFPKPGQDFIGASQVELGVPQGT